MWHLPATAQRTAPADNPEPAAVQATAPQPTALKPSPARPATARPVAPELITFDEYRDFRMQDIARRQARLAHELEASDLSATQKASLEGRKAYYDRLSAMPADQRDQLFRARFDQIDTNHDGMIDEAERAAWREKQRAHYRDLAAARSAADPDQH
jgi:hypothetical protein